MALAVKNLPVNVRDMKDVGWMPGLGRSPEGGHRNPLQYSGLENSMDCIVHGVTKSRTRLSGSHFSLSAEGVLLASSG